jgi:hypothetical protein
MQGLQNISDEELDRMIAQQSGGAPELSAISDEELDRMISRAQIKPPSGSSAGPGQIYQGLGESALAALYGAARGAEGVGRGLHEAYGVPSLEEKMRDVLPQMGLPAAEPSTAKPSVSQYEQSLREAYPSATGVGKFFGELAPAVAIPEARLAEAIGSGLEALGLGAKAAGRVAGPGASGVTGGALGPAYDPDAPLSESIPLGALIGSGVHTAGSGLINAPAFLRRQFTKLGSKTKEQLGKLSGAVERLGLNVPIGEAIDSPGLKRLQQTVVSKIPFSGMSQAYGKISDTLKGHIEGLLDKLNPTKKRAGDLVKNDLEAKFNSLQESADQKYNRVNAMLSKQNPSHSVKNIKDEAAKIKKQIEFNSKMHGEAPLSSYEKLSPIIKSLESPSPHNFKDAIKKDEVINSMMRETKGKERYYASKLKDAHLEDIENTVKKSGSSALKDDWNIAKRFYKNIFVPFRDNKEVSKILDEGTKIDEVVPTIFKTSRTKGKGDILATVSPHISQEAKNAILHEHLSTQIESPGPSISKKISKYDDMQKRQKDLLIDPEDRQLLDDLSTIKEHYGDSFNKMFVEKTGASLQPHAMASMLYGLGHSIGGPVGGALMLGHGIAGGRLTKKALMSDALQNYYLKGLKQKVSPKVKKPSKAISLGLLPFLGSGEENER